MQYRLISLTLSVVLMSVTSVQALAADAGAPQAAASKASAAQSAASKASAPGVSERKKAIAAKREAAAKIKLVDINSASKEELMKLPDISEADAAKIIAGRPYGSKVWLMTHKVLPEGKYPVIKDLIVAKQPYKDAAKNAALYSKQK